MKIKFIYYIAILAFMASCKPEVDEFTPSAGNADFTTYVAVGNSLTAGYADGSLYTSGQMYGWANLLGEQMTQVGGEEFIFPKVISEFGVLPGKLKLGYSEDCLGATSLGPVPDVGELDPYTDHVDYAVNNVGVPGAKIGHLLFNGYGDPANLALGLANPYFVKFATTPTISVVEQALSMTPTFFSLWIGNNDVLGFATSGGLSPITPLNGDVGIGFTETYATIVGALMSSAKGGVLANIPGVTSAAFFTTVPYNAIPITDQATLDFINGAYAPYNAAMEQMGQPYRINFEIGANAMVIFDADMPDPIPATLKFRQITSDELVLMTIPQDSIKCAQWGSAKPIPTQYVLTASEIAEVTNATNAFNDVIKATATANGLAFVDFNSILVEAKTAGIVVDGITFTTTLVTGNLFSLDGIHLAPQGNALVANYFIDAINSTYSANIPQTVVSSYPGIDFP
jgi:lysophospholipase L1-like esterase